MQFIKVLLVISISYQVTQAFTDLELSLARYVNQQSQKYHLSGREQLKVYNSEPDRCHVLLSR